MFTPVGVQRSSAVVTLQAGPVVCEPGQLGYRGATAPTNNAAELEAIERMITTAADMATETDSVEIHSDSRLAIMAALGITRKSNQKGRRKASKRHSSATNADLTVRAREAFARAREKLRGRIVLRKVKGHSGDVWNELADALAAIGRTTAVNAEPHTAELTDRLMRAIDGMGDFPDIACQGVSLAWA